MNSSGNRVNVVLDSARSFSIDAKVAAEAGLHEGIELGEEQLKQLQEADIFSRGLDSAITFLSYRARSQSEIRQKLHKLGFNNEIIVRVIERLRDENLINDTSFAEYWKENRIKSNYRSKNLIRYELIGKGIPRKIAFDTTNDLDDSSTAYKAGLKRARSLFSADCDEFHKRLSNYLKWRGFSYEVIHTVVEKLWTEKEK